MEPHDMTLEELKGYIRDRPDWPKKGVVFRDIMQIIQDPRPFRYMIIKMAGRYRDAGIDVIASPEARGFLIGRPLSYELGIGFAPVRKPGKLPFDTVKAEYELEYGTDRVEMHRDSIKPGQKVLLVDDLLATGGTISAAADMVKELGGEIAGFCFLVELSFLNGRKRLERFGSDIHSMISYDSE